MKPPVQRRSIRIYVGAALGLFVSLGVAGCASVGGRATQVSDPPDRLAAWESRYVRPCAKSGGRLIC